MPLFCSFKHFDTYFYFNIYLNNVPSIGNKNNLISIKNSIIDKQRGRETSTSEVTIKNDNYVNKSDTTFVKNASRLEKRIELEGEKIYINSMIPVTIIEEERENIYNELVSHMIVRKPIIENLSLVDKVFPGLEKYLLDKHRFVLDELDKDYPPGEVVDELIKSLYSEYYNYEENEPTL